MTDRLFLLFLRLPLVGRILFMATITIVFFGIAIHFVEPDSFPTIFDGIWWAIITASTIGYGDFVPTTFEGKLVGISLIVVGAGFVSTYFVSLAATAVQRQNAVNEGKVAFAGKKEHLIIVGWNERSRYIIKELTLLYPEIRIVLIDSTLREKPVPDVQVHFIRGSADQDHILQKAGIDKARTVIITADPSVSEVQADMRSILQLIAVKGCNPSIYSVVEILTEKHLNNAIRAGADEIIQSNYLAGSVLLNTLANHGISKALSAILSQDHGSKVEFIEVPDELTSHTFSMIMQKFYQDEVIVIGIKKRGETFVNPPFDTKIEAGDELLLIRGHFKNKSSSS
ncbi:MAG TPA: ion channel [Bacillus sp. (in: firmicutes)]|uniref:potassium channel family protein n=1 Tax=Bacillus litorisediminis TaxID=2922713 RepID=UPI001FAE8E7B|nr:potassium channel protein [Bacillus litorisediminis]HWO77216.1 ion channel [Bacillus sp. (in: firmicutes)]